MLNIEKSQLSEPPSFCQYAGGPCDQRLSKSPPATVFFAFPGDPSSISTTIEAAAAKVQAATELRVVPWTTLKIAGQTIFCEICKSLRQSVAVVADVTTLNFNLMFEIGYVIGLGIPVIPIRDTSFIKDRRLFDEVGILDTLGYVDFQNSDELAAKVLEALPGESLPPIQTRDFRESPLYVLKGPLDTEGAVRMLSTIKKSGVKFRSYDPIETPRLSLHEVRRQVAGSVGVVSNILDADRAQAKAHNAQSALVAGIAMAQQKTVALLLEGDDRQPIDYRDVVQSYSNSNNIPGLLQPFLHRVIERMQAGTMQSLGKKSDLLHKLDLGDVAAENEVLGLKAYFVPTGQSTQAKQGHARLVVGRKGSGKSAIFYEVRRQVGHAHDRLTLDLKPEGHQFARLREFVLSRQSEGLKEHTLVSFWHYILITELARKALDHDRSIAGGDTTRWELYQALERQYLNHDPGGDFDFSQRLLMQAEQVTARLKDVDPSEMSARITEMFYSGASKALGKAVREYFRTKESVWVLIDNIDKGWPVRGASTTDILIVRALLEATRKLQHELGGDDIEFDCLVFLRSDIYEQLRDETPDKGKDTAIRLDWEDPAVFAEIIRLRVESSTDLSGPLPEIWPMLCTPLIDGQESFSYITDRTLMRPRDLLQFVRHAVQTAINRGNSRVEEDDVKFAEAAYSEDILLATAFEIADTNPTLADALYIFEGSEPSQTVNDARFRISQSLSSDVDPDQVIELLIWYGFLGVLPFGVAEARYAYQVQGNLSRLHFPLKQDGSRVVIHPAFRTALNVSD